MPQKLHNPWDSSYGADQREQLDPNAHLRDHQNQHHHKTGGPHKRKTIRGGEAATNLSGSEVSGDSGWGWGVGGTPPPAAAPCSHEPPDRHDRAPAPGPARPCRLHAVKRDARPTWRPGTPRPARTGDLAAARAPTCPPVLLVGPRRARPWRVHPEPPPLPVALALAAAARRSRHSGACALALRLHALSPSVFPAPLRPPPRARRDRERATLAWTRRRAGRPWSGAQIARVIVAAGRAGVGPLAPAAQGVQTRRPRTGGRAGRSARPGRRLGA